jgi:predicted CoA-substrate-specific enzyme activase
LNVFKEKTSNHDPPGKFFRIAGGIKLITAGIDVGSNTTKVVILKNGEWLGDALVPTGADNRGSAEKALAQAIKAAGIKRTEIAHCVATGYGRINIPFAGRKITEISCHGRGAYAVFPGTRTVIDIGGQDSKVIRVDASGRVVDFIMNDKCAAGTGRFLEVMARALEITLPEMAAIANKSKNPVTISNTCTVFAESEVISYLAQGLPKEDIIRGLHEAIVDRIESMALRLGVEPEVTMTGGVALNAAILDSLRKRLKQTLLLPSQPQLIGAYGAALTAAHQA